LTEFGKKVLFFYETAIKMTE